MKHINHLIKLLYIFLFFVIPSHLLSSNSTTNIKNKFSETNKTSSSWQKWYEHYVSSELSKGEVESWGLFSSGGFHGAGNGHIILSVKDKDPLSAEVLKIKPMFKPKKDQIVSPMKFNLSKNELETFLSKKDKFPQENYTTEGVFDSYKYTYTQFKFKDGQLVSLKSLSMDSPYHTKKASKAYQAIIESFSSLIPKTKN